VKILYLYSDWKWTGPAEPVLQMCKSLQDLGHEVVIAYCQAPRDERETVGKKVAEYGLTGTTRFHMDRHIPPLKTLKDVWNLPRYIAREKFDVVHMPLCHDHSLGGILTKLLGKKRPLLVRTLHRRTVLKDSLGYRLQLKCLTDSQPGYFQFADAGLRRYRPSRARGHGPGQALRGFQLRHAA
jgi:hypothetical protein